MVFLTNIKETPDKEKIECNKITEIMEEDDEGTKEKAKKKMESFDKGQNKSENHKISIIPNKTNLSLQESLTKKITTPPKEFV